MSSAPPAPQEPPQTGETERSALHKVVWFGVIQLAGLVAGWIGSFALLANDLGSLVPANLGPNPTPSQVSATMGPLFSSLSLLLPLLFAVQFVGALLLVMAFRQLKGVDRNFSVPSILTVLFVVGGALLVVGFAGFFSQLPALISQTSAASTSGTVPPAVASALASFIAYLLFFSVGGILSLIGAIGGLILGVWRLASKYDETILKVGAIFFIIPFLDVVAPVLVIVGAHQAGSRIEASQ